jgi:hypothetical protein
MPAVSEAPVTKRHILLVGPYGVLGTGVVDAVAENPKWGITTAARRPVPTYRAQAAPPHVSVDLIGPLGARQGLVRWLPVMACRHALRPDRQLGVRGLDAQFS